METSFDDDDFVSLHYKRSTIFEIFTKLKLKAKSMYNFIQAGQSHSKFKNKIKIIMGFITKQRDYVQRSK